MQQTEKYQLNLIETSDTFSPAALNENAQKLETALTDGLAAARAEAAAGVAAEAQARANADAAEAAARSNADAAEAQTRAAGDAALEQRIIALEGKHAVGGSYVGNDSTLTIHLGFMPVVVFIYESTTRLVMFDRESSGTACQMVEDGFSVRRTSTGKFNFSEEKYFFIAVG